MFIENYDGSSGKLMPSMIFWNNCLLTIIDSPVFSIYYHVKHHSRRTTEPRQRPYIDIRLFQDRMEQVDRFNAGEGKLFLISLRAGGTGLNLTVPM